MEQTTDETRNLRRCVRELAALSVLSAAWGRTEPQGIANSLAEVLVRSLPHVDFVYASVKALSDDGLFEAVHTSQPLEPASPSQEIKKALEPLLSNSNSDQSPVIPHPLGEGNVRLAVILIGYEGDCGILVAGSHQPDFPSPTDKLLLSVAANQAAVVLQHQRSEEALRRHSVLLHEERELLRVTLTSIGDAVVTTDAQERVRFLNPVAESLTGWTTAEATGRPLSQVFKIVNERTRQPVENPVLRALTEGVVVGLANHTVLIARDGTERPIDDSAAPIKDANGTTMGVVLIFRDVTEQRRAEEQLRRSEQELADFFENATIGLHWVGPDGAILRANQAELDFLGYSREEYVGHHIADFHADEEVIGDILRRLHAGEKLHDYPARMRCKDGSIRDVLIDSSVLWEAGRFVHTRCFTRDITEQKRATEARRQLAAIVESSDDAILGKTLDGIITSWNTGAKRLYGYTPDEIIGKHISILVPPPHQNELPGIMDRLRRGERIEHYETVRQRRDGSRVEVSVTISPIVDATGAIIGASAIARDITRQKQMEAALRESDRRKDEFLAMLAHELRNPLAPIHNAVQILRAKGPPVPELQWARDVIDRQVRQMTRLVDDLLDVSRITKGKIDLRRERVELAVVVGSAVEASRPVIEKWGHELTVTMPPEPTYLEADPTRLAQVLLNLLNNAAKYTEQGGRIGLTAERDGDSVLIRVKDTGVGIPSEMLARIFEMFTQVDRSLERSEGGLGIGLTLVRRLVEMHGGSVEAYSAGPGQGSEFVVRLPVAAETKDRGPEGAAGSEGVAATSKWRILVVDDNKDAADSLGMLLRMMGNEVHTAYDGLEAVGAAAALHPEVALLDIGLPKLNGYEAARRIREQRGSNLVLIALTGWGQEEDRRRSKEAGFDHHMTKPVDFEALMKLLSALRPCSS